MKTICVTNRVNLPLCSFVKSARPAIVQFGATRSADSMPVEKEARVGLVVPEEIRSWFRGDRSGNQVPPPVVREWLGQVLQKNYRLFFSIAYGYFTNGTQAEDMVQSAAVKAMQKLGQLKQPELVVEWFASITRNACLDLLRNKMLGAQTPLEFASEVRAPRSGFDETRFDQQRLLVAAIGTLPEKQSIVIRLRFLEDCDIPEIAERLGIRVNAVEVRLHRALRNLRKHASLRVLAEGFQ
jgi:RNA polymerase sigma-70 factor (ECF subfamily)